ncbi:hypothetical protein VOLCADRAFT_116212, partial [Volvox carteri f. nagariensis]
MSSSPIGDNLPVGAGGDVLIKVKTLEPATYEVHVDRQITVSDLKQKLEGIIQNSPANRQRIIYRGRGLSDERTLQDIDTLAVLPMNSLSSPGVENGDTLHMVVRPADAPATTGGGSQQGPSQPQSAENRLEEDTRRILEQINQTMNLNLGMGFNLGNSL